jgi:methyl-accepting chemotaxis protein
MTFRAINDLKLRTKLLGGFASVLVLTVGVGLFSLSRLGNLNENAEDININSLPSIQTASRINTMLSDRRLAHYRFLLASDQGRAAVEAELKASKAEMDSLISRYQTLVASPEEQRLYDSFVKASDEYVATMARMRVMVNEGKVDEGRTMLVSTTQPMYDNIGGLIDQLIEVNSRVAGELTVQSASIFSRGRTAILTLLVLSVVLGMALAMGIARMIARPVQQMADTAQRLALGDVDQAVDHRSGDEIGMLADSFRAMMEYVRGIATAADVLHHGATFPSR